MTTEVIHNGQRSRYEIYLDGEQSGYAEYELADDEITFTHTFTDPAKRGRGAAARLVRHALDDALEAERFVVPQCWYVAQFIDTHEEYACLLKASGSGSARPRR
jgi:predicted GNAT family acetyltransferase